MFNVEATAHSGSSYCKSGVFKHFVSPEKPFEYIRTLGDLVLFHLADGGHDFPLDTILPANATGPYLIFLAPITGNVSLTSCRYRTKAACNDILMVPVSADEEITSHSLEAHGILMPLCPGGQPITESFPQTATLLDRNSVSTQMINSHLKTITKYVHQIDDTTARHFGRSLFELITAACAIETPPSPTTENTKASVAQKFQTYATANLLDAGLTPAKIAQDLGVSRAKLYRLTETFGGVLNYIQNLRLQLAHKRLAESGLCGTTVTSLAHELGFASEATFRRQFKKKFGASPRAVAVSILLRTSQEQS